MAVPSWKKWTILICGLLENLVFSGSILGWSALNYMLKQEGIFSDLCHDDNFRESSLFHHRNESSILIRNQPSGLLISTEEDGDRFLLLNGTRRDFILDPFSSPGPEDYLNYSVLPRSNNTTRQRSSAAVLHQALLNRTRSMERLRNSASPSHEYGLMVSNQIMIKDRSVPLFPFLPLECSLNLLSLFKQA